MATSPLTSDRDRIRTRLLAFAGLSVLLIGLLAAVSFVVIALAALAVLILIALAAVWWIMPLRNLRVRHVLRAAFVSTAPAFRAPRPRFDDLDIPRRLHRLAGRARAAVGRAPGRVNVVIARVVWSYANAVYRLRMRTARTLSVAGRLAAPLSHRRPRSVDRSREALELNEMGARLRREGAHEEAAEHHRAALAIIRDLGDEQAEALTLNSLALALAQGGAVTEAVQHLEQALVVLRDLGDEAHEGPVIANLGIVHRRQGHSEEALHLLQEALDKLPPESPAYRDVEEELRRAS